MKPINSSTVIIHHFDIESQCEGAGTTAYEAKWGDFNTLTALTYAGV